jgi:dienelactone hydrolase
VLAVFGGADRNVDPAVNAPIMRAALSRAGNRDVTILVVPGAHHSLNVLSKEMEKVPYHRQTGFGNQGWPDVARWLRSRLPIPS